MKSRVVAVAALAGALSVSPFCALAQDADSVVLTYERNFLRSSLSTKLEIVKESSTYKAADMGPLYAQALRFVVEGESLLGADVELKSLALAASAKAGEAGYAAAASELLGLFEGYDDPEVRAAAASALATAGVGDKAVLERLNAFVASQAQQLRSGAAPESPTLAACVATLGALGDASSMEPLFAVYSSGVQADIGAAAAASLGKLKGDYAAYLAKAIAERPILEKLAALDLCLAEPSFSANGRGALAESALSVGLSYKGSADSGALAALEREAAGAIRDLRWQRASPLVLQYYRLLLAQYGAADGKDSAAQSLRGDLAKAIGALGAMGSGEAVQALSLQLQLINGQTEQGAAFDEVILRSVIDALGELGDKAAFDYLLYVGYLQYPDPIKQAAKAALQRLKW
jgi:hypothetical protein